MRYIHVQVLQETLREKGADFPQGNTQKEEAMNSVDGELEQPKEKTPFDPECQSRYSHHTR